MNGDESDANDPDVKNICCVFKVGCPHRTSSCYGLELFRGVEEAVCDSCLPCGMSSIGN